MTFAYLTLTLGAMFLYSAFTDKSIPDLIMGRGGPGTVSTEPTIGTPVGTSSNGTGGGTVSGGKAVRMNGHLVCGDIAAIINRAAHDGVHVVVESGVRTVAESVAACQRICGAPSCEGTCAGASSNHNGCNPGAVDIGAGCAEFKSWLARNGNPIRNSLPQDPCHFSKTGH